MVQWYGSGVHQKLLGLWVVKGRHGRKPWVMALWCRRQLRCPPMNLKLAICRFQRLWLIEFSTAKESSGWQGIPAWVLQIGALEIGALEIGALEIGALEIGALEIGALEIGALEIGVLEIGTENQVKFPAQKLPLHPDFLRH
ncbi:hypothetical protein DPEC_G00249560 [Dallia pectoralis]|uniref:Uncharacterized protein n=1 Tax=Dallia pectoralis TaxID=75939 RepID=A0ACC2FT48_DALPE|nr:hypothetical protein DPEC_G00249560 [Dallia pectoralis]